MIIKGLCFPKLSMYLESKLGTVIILHHMNTLIVFFVVPLMKSRFQAHYFFENINGVFTNKNSNETL